MLHFCEEHQNEKFSWNTDLLLASLRKKIMKNDKDLAKEEKWLSEIPYDIHYAKKNLFRWHRGHNNITRSFPSNAPVFS